MARKPAKNEELMRISAAAEAAGVSRQTIEYYILIGLIEPLRMPGRRSRFFDRDLVRRIRLIRQMNKSGYALRDIRDTYLRGK